MHEVPIKGVIPINYMKDVLKKKKTICINYLLQNLRYYLLKINFLKGHKKRKLILFRNWAFQSFKPYIVKIEFIAQNKLLKSFDVYAL